ncbi:WGR domain-containing protein [Polyangium aurulentum]|uniref:WGR domain-containing protein n=1 Tax=Polyangium aurulentum TaxID=2567896 RepID=UPI0010AE1F58|nr:WGR domain-containing protein [Polyangium aurulentum]UQA56898.1 WGR domain-containing protein [Polyangium aurulentum]
MARKKAPADSAPALPAHVLSRLTLPPLPASPGSPYRIFFHPEEGALWLLALDIAQVWRVAADGTGELVASGAALGLPEGFSSLYVHEVAFYFDTARRAPVWLVSTYDSRFGHGLLLGVWNGRGFSALATKNGIRVAGSDGFAFDPARGVLVHFAGQRDMDSANDDARKQRGGLTARELGVDDTWRDVGTPLPKGGTYETYAGWDERRKLAVLIDSDTWETWGWDGAAWRSLPRFPTYPWKPWALAIAPQSKGLVYLHLPREHAVYQALLWELGDDAWVQRDAQSVEVFGGGAYDAHRDICVFYGPWFGPGTVQSTLGRYDGERLVPAGKPAFSFAQGSSGGAPLFFGARAPGHGNYALEVRRPYSAKALCWFKDGALQSAPSSPPVLGVVASAGGVRGVSFTGEVFTLSERGWERTCKAPRGFLARDATNLGCDPQGRVLLTGGRPTQGTKNLTDGWLFDGAAWTEIVAKGSAPVTSDAGVGFDPSRGVWVIVGGRLKNYAPSPKTYEYDGKKWSSFPTHRAEGDEATEVDAQLFAWDEASAQLFVVAAHHYNLSLFVYRGAGAWQPVASLDEIAGCAVAYDAERRTLVGAGAELVAEVAIGAALDAVASAIVQGRANVEEKRGGAKKAAKKAAEPKGEDAIPRAVWLKLQQGDREEFWFASRKGATWSVRSGRRGGKATEKTHTLSGPAEARAAYEKAVRAKLGKGYEHAPEKEGAATIPGKTSFHMEFGKKGEDVFGGLPAGITKKTWPVCADCSRPLMHVLTLHAHEERLPLRKNAALVLFVCSNEDGTCETWDADAGCNAAVFLTADALRKKALREPPEGPDGEEPPEVMEACKIAYSPAFEADPEANENAEDVPATSKVGGYPAWLQFPQTPSCATCEKELAFVAQVQEVDDALNFAGGGDGYLFRCPDEHEAKFFMQR